MSARAMARLMDDLVKSGDFAEAGVDQSGQKLYRLTPQGEAKVHAMGTKTHTPGPWKLEVARLGRGRTVRVTTQAYGAIVTLMNHVSGPYGESSVEQRMADGRLIAAAPALLAKLKAARARIHSDICGHECCADCIEAQREIDLAEGKS